MELWFLLVGFFTGVICCVVGLVAGGTTGKTISKENKER